MSFAAIPRTAPRQAAFPIGPVWGLDRVKFPASVTATKYCNSSNSIDTYPITNRDSHLSGGAIPPLLKQNCVTGR